MFHDAVVLKPWWNILPYHYTRRIFHNMFNAQLFPHQIIMLLSKMSIVSRLNINITFNCNHCWLCQCRIIQHGSYQILAAPGIHSTAMAMAGWILYWQWRMWIWKQWHFIVKCLLHFSTHTHLYRYSYLRMFCIWFRASLWFRPITPIYLSIYPSIYGYPIHDAHKHISSRCSI